MDKDEKDLYSEKTLLSDLEKITNKNIRGLYTDKIVNRKGKTSDTKEYFTEIIIENLYNKKLIVNGKIKVIEVTPREIGYYTKSHERLVGNRNPKSNRHEEIYVKKVFESNDFEDKFGVPIEYQVPLKENRKDCIGKIDLITYKEKDNELYLIEVKADNSTETALRAILEIQTYYQVVDKDNLIKDLKITKVNKKFGDKGIELKENPKILKGIIIFEKNPKTGKETTPAKEFKQIDKKQRPKLLKLKDDLSIEVHYAKK